MDQQFVPTPPPVPSKSVLTVPMMLFLVFFLGAGLASFLFFTQKKEVQTIKLVTEETGEWKTYRNEEYGFEFKYPYIKGLEASVEDKSDIDYKQIELSYPNIDNELYPSLFVTIGENDKKLSLEDWFRLYIDPDGRIAVEKAYNLIKIPGGTMYITGETSIPQDIIDLAGPMFDYAYIMPDSKDYVFSVSQSQDPVVSLQKYLPQILSTFKFIGRVDTSTWKTYRNDKYGYEFKYPQNSEIVDNRNDYIRIQNYDPNRETQFLQSGEYWLGFSTEPDKTSCSTRLFDTIKTEHDGVIFYRGHVNVESYETGGELFGLCAEKNGINIYIDVSESDVDNGLFANQILPTFKFTK